MKTAHITPKSFLLAAVVAGASSITFSPLSAATIVTNGSFEDNSATAGGRGAFTGWTTVADGSSDWAAEDVRGSIAGAQDGDWFAIGKDNNSNPYYFYQTLTTTIGATYQLSFYAARPNTDDNRAIQLDIDVFNGTGDPGTASGGLLDQSLFSSTGATNDDIPAETAGTWNFFDGTDFQFTATSTESTLRFLDNVSTSVDPAIDNVVVEVVPEPGSFALLAGMFGLTWVMLRRRV
jgi:hypothetical protein